MGRAIVLGAGGFLGSHLCRRLVADGWDVVGTVRDVASDHLDSRLFDVRPEMRLVGGDAFDLDFLLEVIEGADVVFPFAAHSGAARSMQQPFANVQANAVGQLAVLEAVRISAPDARVVFPGSRLQYGRPERVPVTEDSPQVPTSLYGLHKATAEGYHRLYADLYGVATCCLRISNPYGPHQDRLDQAFGVVGTFLSTAASDGTITLFGGGLQLREYVYVDDLVDLCIRCVTDPAAIGRAFNAGGPRGMTVREMAETVVRVVGRGRVESAPWPALDGAIETGDYVADLTEVSSTLGWYPETDLEAGLAMTWATLAPALERAG